MVAEAQAEPSCCRACGAALTRTFVDLGKSPLCERLLDESTLDHMEPFYPLHVLVCDDCHLVQLKKYVAPDGIFTGDYPYFSSFSTSWVEHAHAYCRMIVARCDLGADSTVMEIASNDGYLLQHFPRLGVRNVFGIEPCANVAAAAADKGIDTIQAFFGVDLAERILAERGPIDLVVGNNVLAHVPDLRDFLRGVAIVLSDSGIATFEFPHLLRLVAENQFDTIYHEHFSYLSARALDSFVGDVGLKLVDVEELGTHGGSLRVYLAGKKSTLERRPAVDALISREVAADVESPLACQAFASRVRQTKRRLLALLTKLKDEGRSICAYGAPGKGNTLLNYCGIGADYIDFAVDRNPHKHGKYTPGRHIPIRPVEALREARPDYVLILPWNLKAEIVAQVSYIAEWSGRFIVPIPEAQVIDPGEAP